MHQKSVQLGLTISVPDLASEEFLLLTCRASSRVILPWRGRVSVTAGARAGAGAAAVSTSGSEMTVTWELSIVELSKTDDSSGEVERGLGVVSTSCDIPRQHNRL